MGMGLRSIAKVLPRLISPEIRLANGLVQRIGREISSSVGDKI